MSPQLTATILLYTCVPPTILTDIYLSLKTKLQYNYRSSTLRCELTYMCKAGVCCPCKQKRKKKIDVTLSRTLVHQPLRTTCMYPVETGQRSLDPPSASTQPANALSGGHCLHRTQHREKREPHSKPSQLAAGGHPGVLQAPLS